MRKLLNVLYLTQDDFYISKEGESIVIEKDHKKVTQLPLHNFEGIVILGNSTITPNLIKACSEKKINISFIGNTYDFEVRIQPRISGNVILRKMQYRISDSEEESHKIAENCCIGKLFNCNNVLKRLTRDHTDSVTQEVYNSIETIKHCIKRIRNCKDNTILLGIEGEAARCYYGVFNELILNKEFAFNGRSRRPPLDEVNAMLSFFYTLLAHDVSSGLQAMGLDPQVGFYHKIRPGRDSLALDIMEELRPYLVDRFVLSMINNRMVKANDFFRQDSGGVYLTQDQKKILLNEWQLRKKDIITHPFLNEKVEIGLIPYIQAQLLARYIRGDIDGYPPFLMK